MKNENTNNVTATTNNMTIENEKEVTSMKPATTNSPIIFNGNPITKMSFKRMTYDCYLHYVAFMEGTEAPQTTSKALKPLFEGFGIPFESHSMHMLTMMLTNYGSEQGEKVRKVKSITTFRKFILEGYAEMVTKRVVSSAGKAPAAPKAKQGKAKEPTKAELKKEIAALRAQIAQKDQQIEKVEG